MATKMRVGVKSAWILGILGFVGVVLNIIFSRGSANKDESQVQKIEQQDADSGGTISSYNANRDVTINHTYYVNPSDSVKNKPENQRIIIIRESNKQNDTSKKKTEQSPKYEFNAPVDNRNGAIGDNSVVNNYGLNISAPSLKFISEQIVNEKIKTEFPVVSIDSLYRAKLYFQYNNQLRANDLLFVAANVSDVKYIDIHYPDEQIIFLSKQGGLNKRGDRVIKLVEPKNGKIEIEIFTTSFHKSFMENIIAFVDSLKFTF